MFVTAVLYITTHMDFANKAGSEKMMIMGVENITTRLHNVSMVYGQKVLGAILHDRMQVTFLQLCSLEFVVHIDKQSSALHMFEE